MVTGAARGIGRRVALTLVERGYRIAANDLDAPEETLEGSKRAVAFLAGPKQSGFVNGHTLSVDGGWYGGWELGEPQAAQAVSIAPCGGPTRKKEQEDER